MDSAVSEIPVQQNRGRCLLTQDIFPLFISYSASIFTKHLNLREFLIWAVMKYLLQLCWHLGNTCKRESQSQSSDQGQARDVISTWACPPCIHPAEEPPGCATGGVGAQYRVCPCFVCKAIFSFSHGQSREMHKFLAHFHLQNNLAGSLPALLEEALLSGGLWESIPDTIPLSRLFFTSQTHCHASTELPQLPHQPRQPRAGQPENQSHAGYLQMSLHPRSPWVSRWRNASQQTILWLRTSLKKTETQTNLFLGEP